MKMNVLKCKSVSGVLKELAVYLLVYNLVRLAMLRGGMRAACMRGTDQLYRRTAWLGCRMLGLAAVRRLRINPHRPGRWQPRQPATARVGCPQTEEYSSNRG